VEACDSAAAVGAGVAGDVAAGGVSKKNRPTNQAMAATTTTPRIGSSQPDEEDSPRRRRRGLVPNTIGYRLLILCNAAGSRKARNLVSVLNRRIGT
jgi:hypothetical protein